MGREPGDLAIGRLRDERGEHLIRAAVARTGSRAGGEDLYRGAPGRLLHNWNRVGTGPEGYLRRILFDLTADGWRCRGLRRLLELGGPEPAGAPTSKMT
jgi:DNA-directed RNA polymerase specialized sigma24 family protein